MKSLKKTMSLAVAISAGIGFAAAAPEAFAHKHHKHAAKAPSLRSQVRAEERQIRAEDARLRALEDEVSGLRSELSATKAANADVQAKQAQLETQVAEEAAKENAKNNMVFFRGGYASLTENRNHELLTTDDSTIYGTPNNGNGNGWYVGAGMDFRATDDLWGLTDLIALDGELMFEYQNYGESYNAFVSNTYSAATGQTVKVRNQVTMLTIAASPKMKFNLMDGDFRPWIIPFGLAINVVSPPSSGVTVLNPGLMLGTGLEYRIWQDLWVGTDFRYQFTGGDLNYRTTTADGTVDLNQTPTQGLTAGGYIGIGF